ncbi:MAG: hypothetical protein V3T65_06885 [Acidobacteriota bacterium]
MGFRSPVKAKTYRQLVDQANPRLPGQSEALAWVFYDTQNFVDNVSTRLTFFQVTNVDRTITNMVTAGSLPEPQFFEWWYAGVDVLRDVTTSAIDVATGSLDDVQSLVLTSRPTWTFTMSDKIVGPFPLSFCHASGGVTGFGFGTATASVVTVQYANNGVFDGGFCVDGAITIPPKVGFDITLNWPAAVDLTADVFLRFWMAGVLHRRVL